ncbi:MAG: transcriptional regulator, partial [Planctomycetes bacterium]|nr:transcriptional regulator [Planctomycetota bacterium]
KNNLNWYRMDLHLHTPASSDYQEPEVSYLDILQQAERRRLDIIALTDHNTVLGHRIITEEIQQLEWLEQSGRITQEEQFQLDEYRRLFEKMLILPAFEFTATFGFHILGIFSPQTEVRYLEHLLLDLNIPADDLDGGATNVGATVDVLTAYTAIRQAGGIVIAAHANSNHGVAMRGLSFGGQTRIAYTQDPTLWALEVTDLDRRGRRTTARFFDGSKPEYSRQMRCIQGSDAH